MNLDKAKKRITKLVKKGECGYPKLNLEYFGDSTESASEVRVSFLFDEDAEAQIQTFSSTADAREDETVQSTLVKIIERTDAATVTVNDGVSVLTK